MATIQSRENIMFLQQNKRKALLACLSGNRPLIEKKRTRLSTKVANNGVGYRLPQLRLTPLARALKQSCKMVNDPDITARLRAVLESLPILRLAFPEAKEEIAAAFMALTMQAQKIQVQPRSGSSAPVEPASMPTYYTPNQVVAETRQPKRSEYEHLSVAEAAVTYLESVTTQEPQSLKEIVGALAMSGYKLAAEHPDQAINAALRRRMENYTDVVKVGRGRYALRSWFSSERALAMAQHKARTKDGIDQRKARGKPVGAQLKIDIAKAEELFRSGLTTKEVQEHFKLKSRSTIYHHFSKERVRELYEEGRRLRDTGNVSADPLQHQKPSLRVVNARTYPRSDEEA